MYDDHMEDHLLVLLKEIISPPAWGGKEQSLQQLAPLINQQPTELQEALLLAGPTTVLDSILSIIVSQRTKLESKLLAADVLAEICSKCSKACLLLCPSNLVERLMRCASKGDGDMKTAAARALWQLSCHHDFSPEVVSHAGNAFKVVDLLAEDMQQGSSSTCMCALRATQNLLQAYITHGAGDAGDRIGGRIVEPLCNLLEANHAEAAAAAAELLALLGQSAPNRARIVAAGGIQRLVILMRQASNNCSTLAATCSGDTQQQQQVAMQQQETAAAQALHALAQLARGDSKLCLELLGAHVMPGLLQLLILKGCCAGALGLIGDLVALPEGRRALQYADGLAALAEVAQVCPEPLMCRLLSKATKGCALLSHDLASLVACPALLAVLVHCCGTTDRKTRKRALQVVGRLLEHSRATGRAQYLQSQLLALGLLQQIQAVLSSLLPHRPNAVSSSNSNVLELQLTLSLLLGVATTVDVLKPHPTTALKGAELGAAAGVVDKGSGSGQDMGKQQQQPVSELSAALRADSTRTDATACLPATSVAEAVMANPAAVWKHPAAAAAAFGDLALLVPRLQSSSRHTVKQTQKTKWSDAAKPEVTLSSPVLLNILRLLQQLLLSPQYQLPSLQQQVLQVVCELAAHRQPEVLQLMVEQGWVQLLWSFLPGGRQLLAVAFSQLIQQHSQQQEQQQQEPQKLHAVPATTAIPGQPWPPAEVAGSASGQSAVAATSNKAHGLQPQLLQLLDESLPSIEQTLYALQALAHICCCSSAAAVAVQLQASYQAAAADGMLSARTSAHTPQQGIDDTSATPTAVSNSAAAVVAMLFGGSASPRASAAGKAGTSGPRSHSQPPSPGTLPSTPLSFASSSTSTSSGVMGSYVAVAAPSVMSSSLPSSSVLSGSGKDISGDGTSGCGTATGGSKRLSRSSSSGLLSRLGINRKDASSSHQSKCPQASAAEGTASSSKGSAAAAGGEAAATTGASGSIILEPVEDPGSPIEMLVTLLGEQWAATASAELLARLAAAGSAICVLAMIDQGIIPTLTECMKEIQNNPAGAIAALAALLLVQELSSHCPEQLQASGIVTIVLRMLIEGCGGSEAVRRAALDVVVVLCQQGDRQISAAVAQAALLPLVRCLSSGKDQAAAAVVLTALLDSGAIDEPVLAALQGEDKASELLGLCLGCLSSSDSSSDSRSSCTASVSGEQAAGVQQQQWHCGVVQLTAIRLLRSCVELDGQLVDAFLAAHGLRTLLSLLSGAAGSNTNGLSLPAAEGDSAAGAQPHSRLILQYECLAILDSLSLVHRRVLVEAAIIPIIVSVLRQVQLDAAATAATQTAAAPGNDSSEQHDSIMRSSSSSLGLTRMGSRHGTGSSSRGLARSSSKAPGAAAGLSACGMTPAELLLRCKVIACNLITVLAINNEVKRQLFHSDAVGPLMQLADVVEDGSSAQEAIRAALAQLGLVYLLPAGPPM